MEFIDTQHRCAGEVGTPRPQGREVLVWSTGPMALSPEADNQQCQANAIESPRRGNDRPHSLTAPAHDGDRKEAP